MAKQIVHGEESRQAILRGVSIVFIHDDPDFDSVGNIGALLRFRSDHNTAEKMAG